MAGKKIDYTIGVDASDGIQGIQKFGRAVSSELSKVEDDFDETASAGKKVAAALGGVADQIKANLEGSARAADALKTAMGTVGDKADVGQIVADLQRMGLTFEDIVADADELAAALKKLDDVQVAAGAGAGLDDVADKTKHTAEETDKLSDSARGANSAMANMVGNTAQDLGAVGGVVGSLGVGLGQMAEYAADAALGGEALAASLKSMIGVVGPIAALAAATQLVSDVMGSRAKSAEADAKATQLLTDAYRKGGDAAANYADALRETGEIMTTTGAATLAETGAIGKLVAVAGPAGDAISDIGQAFGLFGQSVEDLTPLFGRAGISVDTWSKAVIGGNKGFGDLAEGLKRTSLDAVDQRKVLDALTDAQTKNGEAKRNAAALEGVYAESLDETSTHVKDLNDAYSDAASSSTAFADAQAEGAAAAERVNDLLRKQADALNAQADAAQSAADQQLDVQKALEDYGKVLKDHKATTEEVRDAAIALAKSQAELTAKQAEAAGKTLTATEKLDAQNDALLRTAGTAKGQARQAILDYIGTLNGIPPEVVSEIKGHLERGEIDEAIGLLQSASGTRTTTLLADADTAAANTELDHAARDRTVMITAKLNPNYGAALGPIRSGPQPQAVAVGGAPVAVPLGDDDGQVAAPAATGTEGMYPSVVPTSFTVAVPVTATPTVNVSVQAGVIGSRFEVVRAVRRATRDGVRLAGARP